MNTTTVSAEVDNLFQAWNPTPGNHGAIVGLDRNDPTKRILWSSGNEALWHEVYFGENFTDVNSANNTLPIGGIYKGRITANSFNPSLALGHVYYWRVDEVKADGTTIMRGRVWQFTVADNLLIDDFESYADSSALQAVWTSVASLEPNVAIDQNSLKFTGPAMVSRNTPFADWTTAGVESLSIAVHGSELNLGNSNQLYVKIEDGTASSTIYYDGQNDDLIRGSWYSFQSWNIDLKMFAGVNLTHVTKITIGALSTDLIYVDDIRLHVPRCVSDKMVDINGDCSVDLKDMSLLAANWLKTSSVVNAVDPGTAGLILWYKFNETSGFTAADSSPSPGGKTGIVGGVGDGIWDTSGHNGGCLLFDGTYGLNVPASVFSVIGNQITIGVWVNGNAAAQPVNGALFHGNRNSSLLFYSMCPSGGGEIYFDSGYTFGMTPDTFDSTSYLAKTSAEFEGVWNHYAFVKDVSSGLQRIYCNGVLKAETLGTTAPLSGGLTAFTIGANIPGLNSYAYQGKLDDFKIYNRALSQAEIISLAGQSSVLQPLLTSADTNHDNNVNFNDFAKIAEHWLASNWPN
jgi:hypothetical protein